MDNVTVNPRGLIEDPDERLPDEDKYSLESVKAPVVLAVVAVSMFLPEEASFALGDLRMTLSRLLLLLLAPIVLVRFVRQTFQGQNRFIWSDALTPAAGLWMFVGPITIDGLRALTYCGSSALEFCVPYMAARVFLTKRGQAAALVRILCFVIAAVGALAILDEFARRFVLREVAASISGFSRANPDDTDFFGYDNPDLIRGALFRAASTLDHPILLGTACLLGLLMTTTLRGVLRQLSFLGSAVGLVLSVSSAPIGGTVMGFGTMLYERITRWLPFRWGLLAGACLIPVGFIFVAHPDPLSFFLNHMSLQPGTAYYLTHGPPTARSQKRLIPFGFGKRCCMEFREPSLFFSVISPHACRHETPRPIQI
jgi:hypothetical protein